MRTPQSILRTHTTTSRPFLRTCGTSVAPLAYPHPDSSGVACRGRKQQVAAALHGISSAYRPIDARNMWQIEVVGSAADGLSTSVATRCHGAVPVGDEERPVMARDLSVLDVVPSQVPLSSTETGVATVTGSAHSHHSLVLIDRTMTAWRARHLQLQKERLCS